MKLNNWSISTGVSRNIYHYNDSEQETAFLSIVRGKWTVNAPDKNGNWRVLRTTKSLAKAADYVENFDIPNLITLTEFRAVWSKLYHATPQDEVNRERLYPLWRLDEAIAELDGGEIMTREEYDKLVSLYNDWWETSWSGDNGMTKLAMEFRDLIDAVA